MPINHIYHFTHTDLDGVGCACLSQIRFANDQMTELHIEYCDYQNINEKVSEKLDQLLAEEFHLWDGYHTILITDISVNLEVAKKIDMALKDRTWIRCAMLDHHQLDDEIKAYSWAIIDTSGENCGTSLTMQSLFNDRLYGINGIVDFVENVRLYDLWKFDPETRCKPLSLNMMLYAFGREYFFKKVTDDLLHYPNYTVDLDDEVIDALYASEESYIKNKLEQTEDMEYNGLKGKYVFAEDHISKLGSKILKAFPEIDFAAIIKAPKTVSLRSRDESVNVGEIAKQFGGGGHACAAGFTLKEPMKFTMEVEHEEVGLNPEDNGSGTDSGEG